MTDDSFDKPGNGTAPNDEMTFKDNDPERTLITLDQLSQTIEVMTDVVNRLRNHLTQQISAKLARDEERGLAQELALKSLHDDLLENATGSSQHSQNSEESSIDKAFDSAQKQSTTPQNSMTKESPVNAIVTARMKKPLSPQAVSQAVDDEEKQALAADKPITEKQDLEKAGSLVIEISQEQEVMGSSNKKSHKVLH